MEEQMVTVIEKSTRIKHLVQTLQTIKKIHKVVIFLTSLPYKEVYILLNN